jgi:hypothetical protein
VQHTAERNEPNAVVACPIRGRKTGSAAYLARERNG